MCSSPVLYWSGAAGLADDQAMDLQQAMNTAAAGAVGSGGTTISPSLLTLDAGVAFEKGAPLDRSV